ncbi:MAG: transglutaminase-like domain-containing protein [Pirellula sp.]|nr:transglutaminase-like domain-containing protein [Pirellula sp.]
MTKPSTIIRHSLLFLFLTCVPGCETRIPEPEEERTERILQDLGVAPKPKPVKTEDSSADSRVDVDQTMADKRSVIQPSSRVDDANKPWISADQLPREIWEVQYIGNNPIGYMHRKVSVSKSSEFEIEAESRTTVSLKGEPLVQRLKINTTETDTGALRRIEGSIEIGDNKQTFEGNVNSIDGKMTLKGVNNGQATPVITIGWNPDYRGPFAVDQSMLRRPLEPKETRKLKYFDPILGKVVEGKLKAADDFFKTPTMFVGSRDLLEVSNISTVGNETMQALLWVDEKGEGYKSIMQSADIRSFRTEPIVAQILSSVFDLRAISSKTIKLSGAVDRLMSNRTNIVSQTFRIKNSNNDPFKLFSDRTNQRKKSQNARTVDITVFRVGLNPNEMGGVELKKDNDDSSQVDTDFIPSKSPIIQEFARALVASQSKLDEGNVSLFEKVKVCREELVKRIELKEFDNQIGSVVETTKSKQADCVEHALLFASVCRAMGIPTRIALGMIFNRNKEEPEMKFHAWIEFHDGERWVPSDSSDQQFPTSIDRIKVLESNFTDPNPYLDILKVFQSMTELEISVLSQ